MRSNDFGARVGLVVVVAAGPALSGCVGRYVTPGQRADFGAMGITAVTGDEVTDAGIEAKLARRPAARFPAAIAVARVQAPGYSSYTYRGRHSLSGSGSSAACDVITMRDVETEADLANLAALPQVAGVAPVNRLVVPDEVRGERDLRVMAAGVQADVLLLYTLETIFETDTVVPVLGTITLGVFPSEEALVTCTASAALIDTRTGYVYGLAEATVKEKQLANRWTTEDAVDQSRRRAEAGAFTKLVVELEGVWKGVAEKYGAGSVGERSAGTTSPSHPTPPTPSGARYQSQPER